MCSLSIPLVYEYCIIIMYNLVSIFKFLQNGSNVMSTSSSIFVRQESDISLTLNIRNITHSGDKFTCEASNSRGNSTGNTVIYSKEPTIINSVLLTKNLFQFHPHHQNRLLKGTQYLGIILALMCQLWCILSTLLSELQMILY